MSLPVVVSVEGRPQLLCVGGTAVAWQYGGFLGTEMSQEALSPILGT
jgi:hypothetical protein